MLDADLVLAIHFSLAISGELERERRGKIYRVVLDIPEPEEDFLNRLLPSAELPNIPTHSVRMYAIALAILGNHDDAVEAVHEALLRTLWADTTPDNCKWYLDQAIRNQCRDILRRRKVSRVAQAAPVGEAVFPDVSEVVAQRENFHLLHQAINALDEPYRTVIVLHYFLGLTHPKIAMLLGTTSYQVNNWLSHARRTLRSRLAPTIGQAFDAEAA